MRKIIFHIGNHKTGSSTLQKFLFKNKKLLEKSNIIYPNICIRYGDYGHHNLSFELASFKEFNSKYGNYKKFLHLIKTNKKKNILISSENFERLMFNKKFKDFINKIRGMRYKFVVIFFFREKISLYETMIAEIVKSGYIFKNSDHENNIENIKKNGFFEFDKHRFWFSKRKEINQILENFPVSKKDIICINYKQGKTIKLFCNKIFNKEEGMNFLKKNLIFPKNINLRNGYYRTHYINYSNKIKKIILNLKLTNFLTSIILFSLSFFKYLYYMFRSYLFEDFDKQILSNKCRSKLRVLKL